MENINLFLKNSTIHGLQYIPNSRKVVKLFWIVTVTSGFIVAGFIINQSFESWEETPISTTIETLPISKMTFPKVTVCPPANKFTNLNYDLKMLENVTIDDETKEELVNFMLDELHDPYFRSMMMNLSLFYEENRFYNWYSQR